MILFFFAKALNSKKQNNNKKTEEPTKNSHVKSRQTAKEKKKFYILMLFNYTFFLAFRTRASLFHFHWAHGFCDQPCGGLGWRLSCTISLWGEVGHGAYKGWTFRNRPRVGARQGCSYPKTHRTYSLFLLGTLQTIQEVNLTVGCRMSAKVYDVLSQERSVKIPAFLKEEG